MYFIPQPQKIWEKEGSYCIQVRDVIFTKYEEGNSLWDTIELLNAEIEESLGYRLRIERVGTEAAAGQRGIGLMLSADLKEQEYTLEIGETGIRIRGGSIHAVRYGVQTLRQIIRQQGAVISCLRIEDKPDIANRAFLIDVTRGRIPTLKSLKELADT
ncbi:MAG: glycoside hydrolase family 20 zincin-like fold domain-containing protein, partial [Acetatifactor sp.]